MNFLESIKTCYKKFFDFTGRASKSEYWWFQLYNITIYTLMFVFEGDLVLLLSLLTIANIIPGAAAGVRRIHDINKSGWWILLISIPLVGFYVLFLLISEGSKGKNRFGSKPKK